MAKTRAFPGVPVPAAHRGLRQAAREVRWAGMHGVEGSGTSKRVRTTQHGFSPAVAAVRALTHPSAAMLEISAARPWRVAVGLLVAIAAATELLDLLKLRGLLWPGIHGVALPPEMWDDPVFPSLARALLRSGLLFIEVGIVFLIGRGLGGRGPVSALLATQAFASLPSLLPAVAGPAALRDLADPSGAELVGLVLVNVGSALWGFVLGVIGIRASLALSIPRAAVAQLVGLASSIGLAVVTRTFL